MYIHDGDGGGNRSVNKSIYCLKLINIYRECGYLPHWISLTTLVTVIVYFIIKSKNKGDDITALAG